MTEYTNIELVNLLNMANDFRAINGGEQLDDLRDLDFDFFTEKSSKECVIAKAFNFGCKVWPGVNAVSSEISFYKKEDRDNYCKITGTAPKEDFSTGVYSVYTAYLTPLLNSIAIAFDKGRYRQDLGYEDNIQRVSKPLS